MWILLLKWISLSVITIENLHKAQFSDHRTGKIFTVYRGQGLLNTDFEQMKETKSGFVSFNNFFSTTKVCDGSLHAARATHGKLNSVGILFVMTIDSSKSTTSFASNSGTSYFEEKEDEVLFLMHIVFVSMISNHG
jgi:hypothetical protein